MKRNLLLSLLCLASLTFAPTLRAQSNLTLNPLTSFGVVNGDGSIRPNDTTWMDSLFNQRGLAQDPVTGNVILVDAHSGSSGSAAVQGAIYVLEGTYGTNLLDDL